MTTILIIITSLLVGYLVGFIVAGLTRINDKKNQPLPKKIINDSLVGVTRSTITKIYPAMVASHEMKDTFDDNPLLDEPEYGYDESEESEEVIDIEDTERAEEDNTISRATCVDYPQVVNAVRKVIDGDSLTEENRETIRQIDGTNIGDILAKSAEGYFAVVQDAFAEIR